MLNWPNLTLASVLPPTFILAITTTIWSTYSFFHLLPQLQLWRSANPSEIDVFWRGVWQTSISQILTSLFAVCFLLSVFSDPGSVPDEPEWLTGVQGLQPSYSELLLREVKTSGERRSCKHCKKFKPDRCHHCRICKKCVLKMDHHCPWIMNCVGFRNHKFFFLLVVYAFTTCAFIAFTVVDSVQRTVWEECTSHERFLLVFCMVLACIMGFLMVFFLSFHTWLMLKGMTTIEFCEKSLSNKHSLMITSKSQGVLYDQGFYTNLKAVFGPNPWLWLLPVSCPTGDGLSFGSRQDADASMYMAGPEWTGKQASMA